MRQYAHNHRQWRDMNGTISLEVPKKSYFEDIVFKGHATSILLPMGISICSEKDQFVKKIGREKADSRIDNVICSFIDVCITGTKHEWRFKTNIKCGHNEISVLFFLSTIAESENVHLTRMYLE